MPEYYDYQKMRPTSRASPADEERTRPRYLSKIQIRDPNEEER